MLYHVFGKNHYDVEVIAVDVEESDYVQAVKRKVNPITFNRMIKTLDAAVDWAVQNPSLINRLVWCSAGSLLGYHTLQPKKHIDHLWEKIIAAVGDSTPCLKAMGTMLKWRIAVRAANETWLMYSQETDRIDQITGKKIYTNTYWVDSNFIPNLKPKVKRPNIGDLATKWGAKLT
jgi:hypothetical protein